MSKTPQFLVLSPEGCRALLAKSQVGRLAFLHQGAVDIQPVGYVLRGDWIVMRSAYGTKVAAIEQNPYAAFEVDEIRGPFDWQSVVVRGTIYELSDARGPAERQEYERALAALRAVLPATLRDDDPTPHRNIVYALRIDSIAGRVASMDPLDRRPRAPAPASRPPRLFDGF